MGILCTVLMELKSMNMIGNWNVVGMTFYVFQRLAELNVQLGI